MYKTRCLFDFSSRLLSLEASEFFCRIKNKTEFCFPVFPSDCLVLQKMKNNKKIANTNSREGNNVTQSESEAARKQDATLLHD